MTKANHPESETLSTASAGIDRRAFLAGSLAVSSAGSVLGANDRINVAVIGLRGRGRTHMECFTSAKGSRVTAICDVDDAQIRRGRQFLESLHGPAPKTYRDLRKVFEDKEIDAVSVATPNHWHSLATIWACQAGKDVYVEKPASHNIWEGRRAVEASRKYNRMVQCGLQARSLGHYREAVEQLRQNAIGKVYLAKGLCYKRRLSIGTKPDGPVPEGVDYDLWRGPAAMRSFNPNRFHYNWHWFWDTGNGDIGNQGVHEMDIGRWGLGEKGPADQVMSMGRKFIYDDDQETPNTQIASFHYDNREQIFEVRGLITGSEGNMTLEDDQHYIGVIFLGSEGYLTVDSNGYQIYHGEKRKLASRVKYFEDQPWSTLPHVENFLKAVRSRKREDLNCDILEAHLSTTLCHLANASYRTRRALTYDTALERFGDDSEANRMLSREYRAPFVVPQEV